MTEQNKPIELIKTNYAAFKSLAPYYSDDIKKSVQDELTILKNATMELVLGFKKAYKETDSEIRKVFLKAEMDELEEFLINNDFLA